MIAEIIGGMSFTFKTDKNMFSPSCVDKGTLAMLSAVNICAGDKILDLGCGYGVVGIYAAKLVEPQDVVMSDIDKICVGLARENAELNGVAGVKIIESDGFRDITDKDFTIILSNPPYHTDFSVAKHFIEKGFNRLQIGGKMYMVTKRKEWYKNKLLAIFGGVKVTEIEGYFVFCAEKRKAQYDNKKAK